MQITNINWGHHIFSSHGGFDMKAPILFEKEFQFCLIVWEEEPVSLNELTYLCKENLGWERTTTYTMIQRLERKGVIQKDGRIVRTLISKETVQDNRTEDLIEKTFGGKLSDLLLSLSRLVSIHFGTNK